MAFNKAKALHEAEKSVRQGKFSQAIRQYLDVFEHDPRDLGLLNTVGDLCVREGNLAEAVKVFHRLADAYKREGFILRAIAIYRKIVKLDLNAVEPLIELAELYAAQGLGRAAREHYGQALELCRQKRQPGKALEIMAKIVAADPENVLHRLQLAELAEALGRKAQAASAYLDAAAMALRQGDRARARQAFDQAASLEPSHPKVASLRDQMAFSAAETAKPAPRPESATEIGGSAGPASGEPPEVAAGRMPPASAETPAGAPEVRVQPGGEARREPAASAGPVALEANEQEVDAAAAEFAAASQEMDLLSEWEMASALEPAPSEAAAPPDRTSGAAASEPEAAPAPAPVFNYDESRAEIEFYLQSGFVEQARAVIESLEHAFPDHPQVVELRSRVDAQTSAAPEVAAGPAAEGEEVAEARPEPGVAEAAEAEPAASAVASSEPGEVADAGALGEKEEGSLSAWAGELVLGTEAVGFRLEGEPVFPAETLASFSQAATEAGDGRAADQEPGCGQPESAAALPSAFSDESARAESLEDLSASPGTTLAELQEEAAQPPAPDDPATHYDLGVAFREMGLLDEAIGELQKVIKAAGGKNYPPQFLAACTLLGQCFMDKNLPAIATKWYQRALEAPQLDPETALALQYDLGLAWERAGDSQTALQKFLEVYSQNVDYRDVAEKIRFLQQKS